MNSPKSDAEERQEPAPAHVAPTTTAKRLARGLPTLVDNVQLVPARMVNEVLYCERLMYLEWVQGEFADNYFTVDGRAVHRRADTRAKPLRRASSGAAAKTAAAKAAAAEADDATPAEPDDKPYSARSVWLSSELLGVTAKIDVVDVDAAGRTVIPIEYKRGKRPDVPEGAYLPERAQVCTQALLLREHGFDCDHAEIYFAADRQRVRIELSDALIATTLAAIARAKQLAVEVELPAPLVDSPKCNGCSLVGICLPDEVTALNAAPAHAPEEATEREDSEDPWGLAPTAEEAAVRRLHPARDDRVPLLVQEQGARICLDGERLVVKSPKTGAKVEGRLTNTSEVNVFGNAQVTTQALRAVLQRGIPVSFFTYGGWYIGRAVGFDSKNVELRLAQYAAATTPASCLDLARRIVVSKILNCRTLLRRNIESPSRVALSELRQLARKAAAIESLESLLGIEGTAARTYFGCFTEMLKASEDDASAFELDGRNRRPPRDPVNALLSFCYALLTKDFAITLANVGLDPLLGFYHQPRFGRPALALDLMEEFRPLVADSVVVSVINNRVITPGDFVRAAGSVALSAPGRKRLILAYERRMDQLVTHPVFGYRISYRRVLEVQARLLSRYLLGELAEYPSFRTR
jgi:CRISPR-associated protein Cas1